jgi:dystonin
MEPHTVDVESLMTQADELIMRTSLEQAEIVSVPVLEIEQRWESLWAGVNERQYELENALVRLGQFRHALAELVSWIVDKDAGLDSWTIPFGDSKTIELEMAKHKVRRKKVFFNQSINQSINQSKHR